MNGSSLRRIAATRAPDAPACVISNTGSTARAVSTAVRGVDGVARAARATTARRRRRALVLAVAGGAGSSATRAQRQPRVVARRAVGARRQDDAHARFERDRLRAAGRLRAAPASAALASTRVLSTRMPLVEPASATHHVPLSSQISQWRRLA